MGTRDCQKFLQLKNIFCRSFIAVLLLISCPGFAETYVKFTDEFINKVKIANNNKVKIIRNDPWAQQSSQIQDIIESTITEFLIGPTKLQKQICELMYDPGTIFLFTGVRHTAAEKIFKDCHRHDDHLCDTYGCYGSYGSGRNYIFIFADKSIGYDSFTDAATTVLVITPQTTMLDLKRMIFHELAIGLDFKNDEHYEYKLYLDAEFGPPWYSRGYKYIDDQHKNDRKWQNSETALSMAFYMYGHSFIQQATAAIRAYAVEDIILNKKDIVSATPHEKCILQVTEVLTSIMDHKNIYYSRNEVDARVRDTNIEFDFSTFSNPEARMVYSRGKENLTFCQFMIEPQFHPYGRGDYNIGPRPTIRPGGWTPAAGGEVLADGSQSVRINVKADSSSSKPVKNEIQNLRDSNGVLVNDIFKNQLQNGNGVNEGGSGGVD